MNAEYLRGMEVDELEPLAAEQLKQAGLWREEYAAARRDWFRETIALLRMRYRTLMDFAGLGRPYFSDEFDYDSAAVKKNLKDERLKELIPGLAGRLNSLEEFTHDATEAALRAYSEEQGVKAGLLINAARTALTGQSVGPGIFDIMMTLGRERTLERLNRAVRLVGQ